MSKQPTEFQLYIKDSDGVMYLTQDMSHPHSYVPSYSKEYLNATADLADGCKEELGIKDLIHNYSAVGVIIELVIGFLICALLLKVKL